MVKRKKFIILAVAIILMPFLENLLGLGQIFGAFAQAEATSGETVLSDPNGRLTVVKDSEEEADGNMVWNLTMRKANDENESSKLKVSLTDETAAQGVTLTGDGFQTSGAALVENDFTDDERKMTITAPVGVTVNLSVDYDLRKEIMPAAKMDSESDSEEDGEPASPVTETTENVISANNTDAGAIQLETPADVLEAKAAEEAAQAEAEAKAAEEAAQAEAEAKAAEEAAQAEAEAKAAEEAAQAEAEAKAAEEAAQAEAEATEEAAQAENDTPATDDSEKDIEKVAENDTADSDEAEVQGPTFRASSMALTSDMILNSAAGQTAESNVEIITNSKSAYLTNWDARTYNLDIHVETKGDFISGAARVMLVLDTSGSMDYKLDEDKKAGDGEKSRLDVLKTTAASFINQLKGTNSSVAVVKYGREASAVTTDSTDPTTFTSTNQENATNALFKSVTSEDDATSLISTIRNLKADGATRSDLGLGLAYHSIKTEIASNENDTRPVYVIFMSDGVPTTGTAFNTDVARRAEQWASMIKGNSSELSLNGYDLTIESKTQEYKKNNKGKGYSWQDITSFGLLESEPSEELKQTLTLAANKKNPQNSNTQIYYSTDAKDEVGNTRTIYRFKAKKNTNTVTMAIPTSSYDNFVATSFTGDGTEGKPYLTDSEGNVTITNERPLLQWKSTPEVYAIQQSSTVPDNVEKFMKNVATDAAHFLNASKEKDLEKIFGDIASKIKSTGVTDVLDKRFEIDESKTAALSALKAAGMSYAVNDDGTTTISWDKMPDKDGIMEIIASIPIKAKEMFVGANAVPTNVSDLSGIFIDGTRTPFSITNGKTGDKYNDTGLTNPYVNVKLMDLKDVNTSEGPHEPDADAMAQEDIKNGWLAQTQLTDGTDYDSKLGAYPGVTTTGIKDYQSKARAFTYHETSNATAVQIGQEKNDETDAGAYADGFGQGSAGDDKSKMVGNVAEGNLTHEVKVKAVPKITTNKKSAHLVDWDKRVYQVDLTARVDFAQNTADPLVLLVLDASGSMINNNMGGKTRLSVMKDVATGLVTDLSEKVPSADVGVIRFSNDDNTKILSPFVSVKDNSSTINQAINDITTTASQYTRADDGFKLAYQMLSAYKDTNRPVYIMYLTDGVPTRSSSDFNFKIASDAQSYRSLIIGQTSNYSNGTSEKVEKGRYDVDNLKESSIETNWWGQKTTYYHGVATSSSVNPPLGISNTTIYSVLQADNYSENQGKPYMDFMASDPNKSVKASSVSELEDVFADFLQEIDKPSLVDVVDPHFELTAKSKADLIAAGATVSEYSPVNGTTITWNEIPLNEPVTKSFQIKAVDSYIGENVVPTNIYGKSGINVNGSLTQFDIYAGDTKTDLDTPYVNVKLKPFTGAETSETIWLGQDAKAKGETTSTTTGEIYGDWQNDVNYHGFKADYPPIVFDDELNATDNKGYEEKPEVSKVYSETGTATANTLTENELAEAYADGYAFTHLKNDGVQVNDKGQVNDNFTTGDFKHTVTIETGVISYLKHLEGLVIPSTVKDFSPTFTVTTDSMSTQSTWNYREHTLALSNLGIGTYTINENTPDGIKAASWTLVVGSETTKYPTELTYTLTSGTTPVTYLNNEWNDFKIRVQKKDDLGQALLGAEFTLTNVTDPDNEIGLTLETQTDLSIFNFGGLAPGTYELKETKTPKGHTGLADPITILIGKDGVVKIDGAGEEWVVEEGSNVITLDVTNKVKGVLPSTGGPGRQMFSVIALILMLSVAGISVIYVHRNRKGGA